jgi:hypothetical protein
LIENWLNNSRLSKLKCNVSPVLQESGLDLRVSEVGDESCNVVFSQVEVSVTIIDVEFVGDET